MECQHTPGPWSLNGNKVDGNGYHIATINSHRTSEGSANGTIIALAPDMLDALIALAHMCGNAGAFGKPLNDAVALIAKCRV